MNENKSASAGEMIFGRNPVLEQIRSARPTDKIYIQKGLKDSTASAVCSEAKKYGIPVVEIDKKKLDSLSGGLLHQGLAASVSGVEYVELDDILNSAAEKNEKPFIVLLDSVTDPQNLGAVIRTAEASGVHGVVITKRGCAGVTAAVLRASAGAAAHMMIARVPNLAAAVDELKEKNVWVYAAEADGKPYYSEDLSGACAFVFGGEDSGVSRLVREKSDFVLSIPMHGKINSLNVSASAAVILTEAAKQRSK